MESVRIRVPMRDLLRARVRRVCRRGNDTSKQAEKGEDGEERCKPGVFECPLVQRENRDGDERNQSLYVYLH